MKHEDLLKSIGELPLDGVTVRYDGSPLETISTMSDLKWLAADYRRAIEKLKEIRDLDANIVTLATPIMLADRFLKSIEEGE